MAGYLIATYDITNPEAYPAYIAAVGATLAATTLAIARRSQSEQSRLPVSAEPVRSLPPVI